MEHRKSYSAVSFRQSLESRLQSFAKVKEMDLQRVRRKVAFERFLARLFCSKPYQWVLKGGYALEARLDLSRATKDIDLGTRFILKGSDEEKRSAMLAQLQRSADIRLNDYFQFRVEPTNKLIQGAPYGGFRFPVRSFLAGKLFVAFPIDIGMGDIVSRPFEEVEGEDWLDFCGVSPAKYEMISMEQQFAEKVHALGTCQGDRENTRVKDLVDVLLLIKEGLKKERAAQCIKETFKRRGDFKVPSRLPHPPENWKEVFNRMAEESGLDPNFDEACEALESFWELLFSMGFNKKGET